MTFGLERMQSFCAVALQDMPLLEDAVRLRSLMSALAVIRGPQHMQSLMDPSRHLKAVAL